MTRRALEAETDVVLEAAASRRILLNCIRIQLFNVTSASRPTTVVHSRTRHRVTRPFITYGSAAAKSFGGIRRFAAKQQHRAVGRIGQRSAKNKLTTRLCRPGVGDVRRAQRHAALDIVVNDVVHQQEMHGDS